MCIHRAVQYLQNVLAVWRDKNPKQQTALTCMLYVPATSWCAMASNKSLPLAVVSIIRYPGKHDSASQESLISLFGPPSLLANDKYFKFFTLPKIRGAPGAPPPLDPLLLLVYRRPIWWSPKENDEHRCLLNPTCHNLDEDVRDILIEISTNLPQWR